MPETAEPAWPVPPEHLRAEVQAMLHALTAALDTLVPPERQRGLYFKGSGSKTWYAPCDYVPELSDLDLHVWLDDATADGDEGRLAETETGLRLAEAVEQGFLERVPRPLHWPRPQVLVLNRRIAEAGWSRSPALVLRGAAYPGAAPSPEADRATLWRVAKEARQLGLGMFDKVGGQTWSALRALHFRLSPLPSRLLSASGAGEWAWGQPRSVLITELRARGIHDVADLLDQYYWLAWQAFLGRWQDGPVMRQATLTAVRALTLAAQKLG